MDEQTAQCLVTCRDYMPRTCSQAHRCELPQGHEGAHQFAHGASREFTIHQLALIREAIATVLDDGHVIMGIHPYTGCPVIKFRDPWNFYAPNWREDSDESNADRVSFCDAVQRYLVERSK